VAAVVGAFDRLRLEQVLGNLIANAIKYGAGQPIEVTVESDGEQARVHVEDHGIGIPPEKLDVIFERFERAASARSYGGLGLGLYIARQIVDAHRGSINVRSKLSRGSVFTLTLPLKWTGANRTDADRSVEVRLNGDLVPRAESRTVLLVEDDLDVREAICDLLESHGYRVASACNGQEALECLRGGWGPPDVILLDLMMPVMNGWQFRSEQQKSPEWSSIPVVLVSGDSNAGANASAINAVGFLKKPPTAEDLLGLVDRVCTEADSRLRSAAQD
jgi:CheY-like chemotaxis protein/anti-sigma regulatory factor (Ser/Thr protein kinase)